MRTGRFWVFEQRADNSCLHKLPSAALRSVGDRSARKPSEAFLIEKKKKITDATIEYPRYY